MEKMEKLEKMEKKENFLKQRKTEYIYLHHNSYIDHIIK